MGKASGNAAQAAIAAGYSKGSARQQGQRLLTNADIRAAIEKRQKKDPDVADREERQRFWSAVMRDENADMKDRIKASEVLGKSQADFVERHEHSGPNGQPIQVIDFTGKPKQ